MRKFMKKASTILLAGMLAVTGVVMTGCSSKGNSDQVVIYSNADDEAVEAMKRLWMTTDIKESMFSRRLELLN